MLEMLFEIIVCCDANSLVRLTILNLSDVPEPSNESNSPLYTIEKLFISRQCEMT